MIVTILRFYMLVISYNSSQNGKWRNTEMPIPHISKIEIVLCNVVTLIYQLSAIINQELHLVIRDQLHS